MSNANGKETGSIKWFSENKGYGFIKPASGGADVFVHINELRANGIINVPPEGTQVSYVIDKRPKGPYATQISVVGA